MISADLALAARFGRLANKVLATKLRVAAIAGLGGLLFGLILGVALAGDSDPEPRRTPLPAVDTAKPCPPHAACAKNKETPRNPGHAPKGNASKGKKSAGSGKTKKALQGHGTPAPSSRHLRYGSPHKLSRKTRQAFQNLLHKAKRAYRRHRYPSALIFAQRALKLLPTSVKAEKLRKRSAAKLGL